ncbi:MAG: hypothetical protein ACLRWP_11260 [Bilophila wadsworthia]
MNGKAEELAASHIIVAPAAWNGPSPSRLDAARRHGRGRGRHLLRSGGTLSADKNAPVVLAGNGPLPPACRAPARAGVPIAAWLDTGWWSHRIMAGALCPLASTCRMSPRA